MRTKKRSRKAEVKAAKSRTGYATTSIHRARQKERRSRENSRRSNPFRLLQPEKTSDACYYKFRDEEVSNKDGDVGGDIRSEIRDAKEEEADNLSIKNDEDQATIDAAFDCKISVSDI
ncbi:hypothetical protein RvY_03595 [Ramazzottius varieornatus]|uniref:Uncharacterized protein n=1 Tax=Ramazzottius varieornatus TaxID=947166 RepID=A0A1D1UYS5_RAMVA|nr:hypothetical protein RvY_03595 [Ramazzottius varieornatus]